jgi:predicted dehydrogenase
MSHVGVIGCGLMGRRRAEVVREDARVESITGCDVDLDAAKAVTRGGSTVRHWQDVVANPAIDTVVIATPNAGKHAIVAAALEQGKHVLLEKPMGASLADARTIAASAAAHPPVFKVGFNHRYYPGIVRARELVSSGELGTPVFARAIYGHGAHREFAGDWRCASEPPGGGQLLDQGSHVLDLLTWLLGRPSAVKAQVQSGFYTPVDDNVFALLSYGPTCTAQLHVSWTQWKNRFSFEVAFTEGSIEVNGLTRSYGPHRVAEYRRAAKGAPHAVEHEYHADETLRAEWREFSSAIERGTPFGGTAADGLAVMETAYRIRAAASGGPGEE